MNTPTWSNKPVRDEERRRKRGLCKSCNGIAPVRPRSFWTTGIRMLLCCECERQFTLNTGIYGDVNLDEIET